MTPGEFHPEVEERGPQTYIGSTATVTMATIGEAAERIPEIIRWLGERGISPAGAPFLRYRVIDMENSVVVESAVPVDDSVRSVDHPELRVAFLPAGRYVTLIHHGPVEQLLNANAALMAWATEQNIAWDLSEADDGQHWACRLEIYASEGTTQIAIKTA